MYLHNIYRHSANIANTRGAITDIHTNTYALTNTNIHPHTQTLILANHICTHTTSTGTAQTSQALAASSQTLKQTSEDTSSLDTRTAQ